MAPPQTGSYDATFTKPPKSLNRLPEARLPNGSPVDFGNGPQRTHQNRPQADKKPKPQRAPLAQSETQPQSQAKVNGKKKNKPAKNDSQDKPDEASKTPQKSTRPKKNGAKKSAQQVHSPLSSPDLTHPQVSNNYALSSTSATASSSGKKTKKQNKPSGPPLSPSYAGSSFMKVPDVSAIPKPSFL